MQITLNLPDGRAGAEALDLYIKDLNRKVTEMTKQIAEVGAEEVIRVDGEVTANAEPIPNGHKMVAQGERIVFLEFGTGALTDSGGAYSDTISVPVHAGSWSDEHEGTWRSWLESGKDPMAYPYNRSPKRGMYMAMRRMVREGINIAKAVFRE